MYTKRQQQLIGINSFNPDLPTISSVIWNWLGNYIPVKSSITNITVFIFNK